MSKVTKAIDDLKLEHRESRGNYKATMKADIMPTILDKVFDFFMADTHSNGPYLPWG